MASKVKEIHQYDGTRWGQAVPIGADASNVDVKTSDNTDISLQSVLGSFNATEPSIKTQINGKVDKEGGDVAHAVINDPVNEIPIYDLDTEETSEKLISDDISTDTDMVVMSGDGENLTTMWGKFNRFRKRVDNKFKNYLVTSLEGVAPGASSDTKGYSTQALNNYFSDVIGYTSAASVAQTGSVASQLSSLNSNIDTIGQKFGAIKNWSPQIYDYETYKSAITSENSRYVIIDKIAIYWSNIAMGGNITISTMLQIRNFPQDVWILGGSIYVASFNPPGSGIVQIAHNRLYPRSNLTGTLRTGQWLSFCVIGVLNS